jgi:threonylcarbamoyladenosine tRNA methylthiotransferase MtaB
MRRQYLSAGYLEAVDHLRSVFPDAAFTTDVLTGFPGETEEEFNETREMIRKVGFARIHVFPFSPRPGTPASEMPGQLSDSLKQARSRELIALGKEVALCYQKQWIGRETVLLPEEQVNNCWEGYSPEYLRIRLNPEAICVSGEPVRVRILSVSPHALGGVMI